MRLLGPTLASGPISASFSQGRITLPGALRDYAGLDGDVIVVGNGTTAEIWDSTTWESYLENQEDGFSGINEEVIPGVM